jgi:hypothetical protein
MTPTEIQQAEKLVEHLEWVRLATKQLLDTLDPNIEAWDIQADLHNEILRAKRKAEIYLEDLQRQSLDDNLIRNAFSVPPTLDYDGVEVESVRHDISADRMQRIVEMKDDDILIIIPSTKVHDYDKAIGPAANDATAWRISLLVDILDQIDWSQMPEGIGFWRTVRNHLDLFRYAHDLKSDQNTLGTFTDDEIGDVE